MPTQASYKAGINRNGGPKSPRRGFLDQIHAGPYTLKKAIYPPIWAFLVLIVYPTPRG